MSRPISWLTGKPVTIEPRTRALVTSSPSDTARSYAADAIPDNTRRTYAVQWGQFLGWLNEHNPPSLPASPTVVSEYIAHLAKFGLSPATIDVALASIAKHHELRGWPNPRASIEVRTVRKGIRNRHGTAATGKGALTVDQLRAIVAPHNLSKQGLRAQWLGLRDDALLLVGFAGAFRRSELVALNLEDVKFSELGLELTIRRSKTDQEGKGRLVGIPVGKVPATCPVAALQRWCIILEATHKARPSACGALFRSVDKAGWPGGRLPAGDVGRIVKGHLDRIGVDSTTYGAHSLRVGFVTAAIQAGKSRTAIKRQTGHRSDQMVDRYARPVELFDDNPADGIGL